MTVLASILSAIKSLASLGDLLQSLVLEVKNLTLVMEQKQIETFKKEVNETLEQIKMAQDDGARKRLIVELSKRLSK